MDLHISSRDTLIYSEKINNISSEKIRSFKMEMPIHFLKDSTT